MAERDRDGRRGVKSRSTIQRHIRDLRSFIDRPVSARTAAENIIAKRIAYCVETVLRYETERVVGWEKPIDEVLHESQILFKELQLGGKSDG